MIIVYTRLSSVVIVYIDLRVSNSSYLSSSVLTYSHLVLENFKAYTGTDQILHFSRWGIENRQTSSQRQGRRLRFLPGHFKSRARWSRFSH